MKFIKLFLFSFIIAFTACAPTNGEKSATFKVWGNCDKCKKTIENACNLNGVTEKNWNVDSKLMTLKYDTTIISLDILQQTIAKAGYDNDMYYGDDYAYAKLEACCQYDRKPFDMK